MDEQQTDQSQHRGKIAFAAGMATTALAAVVSHGEWWMIPDKEGMRAAKELSKRFTKNLRSR